jgi:hypothetical protein
MNGGTSLRFDAVSSDFARSSMNSVPGGRFAAPLMPQSGGFLALYLHEICAATSRRCEAKTGAETGQGAPESAQKRLKAAAPHPR